MINQELSQWRVVGASICGRSHEKVKQLCQDAHQWEMLSESVLVAAVADGAGSAKLGKVGAIVAAQTAVETVCLKVKTFRGNIFAKREPGALPWGKPNGLSAYSILGESLPLGNHSGAQGTGASEDDEAWKLLLNNALESAKTAVEAEAIACNMTARDLATTLIIVVATPELVAFAQVGDGVAVVGDVEGHLIALTTPQNGEYINETTFLVSPNALETAQVNVWYGSAANVALLSDGLQMLALQSPSGTPHRPFFSPLFQFVADVTDESEAKDQLVAFLRSDRIANRTDDDLTLVLGHLSLVNGHRSFDRQTQD